MVQHKLRQRSSNYDLPFSNLDATKPLSKFSHVYMQSWMEPLLSEVFYCLTSASTILFNKHILSVFKFPGPNSLLCFQMFVACLLLHALNALGFIRLQRVTWAMVRVWLPLNILFVLMNVSGFCALRGLSAGMFTVLKNLSNLFTIIGDRVFLQRTYSWHVYLCLGLMVLSTICGAATDLSFSLEGYTWQIINCVLTSAYSLYLSKVVSSPSLITPPSPKPNPYFEASVTVKPLSPKNSRDSRNDIIHRTNVSGAVPREDSSVCGDDGGGALLPAAKPYSGAGSLGECASTPSDVHFSTIDVRLSSPDATLASAGVMSSSPSLSPLSALSLTATPSASAHSPSLSSPPPLPSSSLLLSPAATPPRAINEMTMVYLNNLLSMPLLLVLALATDEVPRVMSYKMLTDVTFVAIASLGAIVGFGVGFSSIWCVAQTSATVYGLTGSMNKVVVAAVGIWIFNEPVSLPNLLSITLGILAGVLLVLAKTSKGHGKPFSSRAGATHSVEESRNVASALPEKNRV